MASPPVTQPPAFYRRPLPATCIPFASAAGRGLFRDALAAGEMEAWFALSEQFHTQSDPAFCGLGTLVVVLNALEIDPGRIWKGPWRWFGEELLDCCLPLDHVREKGITLDELACLARCNGARARVVRADSASVDELREIVRRSVAAPRGPFVVAAYSRKVLGQSGEGHFSPLGGYHAERDLVLVQDVARFKYPPHWVALAELHKAMHERDPVTGRSRGFVVLDRSPLSIALFFRLSLDGDSRAMHELVERLRHVASSAGSTPPLPELDADCLERMSRWTETLSTSLTELSAEHRCHVEKLLGELRETTLYGRVRSVLSSSAGPLLAETLTLLLLALARTGSHPEPPAELAQPGREDVGLGPTLAQEVDALREQLGMLARWVAGNSLPDAPRDTTDAMPGYIGGVPR